MSRSDARVEARITYLEALDNSARHLADRGFAERNAVTRAEAVGRGLEAKGHRWAALAFEEGAAQVRALRTRFVELALDESPGPS